MKSFAEFADNLNMSILLVEQKVGDALAFADRAIVLENGAIALSDTTANLRADQKVLDRYISIA